MDTDLALILGLVVAGFTVPSVLSALSERRPPLVSVLTGLIAIGLITYAYGQTGVPFVGTCDATEGGSTATE